MVATGSNLVQPFSGDYRFIGRDLGHDQMKTNGLLTNETITDLNRVYGHEIMDGLKEIAQKSKLVKNRRMQSAIVNGDQNKANCVL